VPLLLWLHILVLLQTIRLSMCNSLCCSLLLLLKLALLLRLLLWGSCLGSQHSCGLHRLLRQGQLP
jgi:hypothetical protein